MCLNQINYNYRCIMQNQVVIALVLFPLVWGEASTDTGHRFMQNQVYSPFFLLYCFAEFLYFVTTDK